MINKAVMFTHEGLIYYVLDKWKVMPLPMCAGGKWREERGVRIIC